MPPGFPPLVPGALFLLGGGVAVALLRRLGERAGSPGMAYLALVAALLAPALFAGRPLVPLDNLRGAPPFHLLPATEPHGNHLQGDLLHLVLPAQAAVRAELAAGRWPLIAAGMGLGMPLLGDPQAQALQPLAVASLAAGALDGAGVLAAWRLFLALLFTHLLLVRQGLGQGAAAVGALAWGLGGFVFLWLGWPLATTAALLPALLWAIARLDEEREGRDAALLAAGAATLVLAGHPETILYAGGLGALVLAHRIRRRPAGCRAGLARAAGLATLVAAGVAAPALLPAAPVLLSSERGARLGDGGEMAPAPGRAQLRLTALVAPSALGNSRFNHWWGEANTNEDAGGFVGTVALLLAAAGLMRPRRTTDGPVVLAALAAALLLLLLPLPVDLSGGAAGGGGFHRLLLVVGFALAWLAAAGAQAVARLPRWVPLALAAAFAAAIAWAYAAHPPPGPAAEIAVYHHGWQLRQLRLVAAAALLLALAARRRATPWALAALVAVELVALHRPAWPAMPRQLAAARPPAIELLTRNAGEGRVSGVGDVLRPNLAAFHGLADLRVYNPAVPAAYRRLLQPLADGSWGEMPRLGHPGDPLYRRLGVRWLVSAPREELPAPLRLRHDGPDARVWEVPGALPVVFLPSGAERRDERWEAPDRLQPAGLAAPEPARLTAALPGGPRRLLATSLLDDGGWRLLVDGTPQPAFAADGPLLAAWLPAGARRLDLLYRPPLFLPGLLLAAIALAAGMVAWWPPPRPAV